jgi:hypothetical protein
MPPSFVAHLRAARHPAYPGIRAEQIDVAEFCRHLLDQTIYIALAAYIRFNRKPAEFFSNLRRSGRVRVGNDHAARAASCKPAAQRAAYAVCAAGHDDDFIFYFHLNP